MSGDVFVIVEWSLGDFRVSGEDFRFEASELMLLAEGEDDVGYVELPAWMHAKGVSFTWRPGVPINQKRLFIVKQENLGNLQLSFFSKEYPLRVQSE